ncbi:hypothetical protein ES705_15679 [subsurface metagenome]
MTVDMKVNLLIWIRNRDYNPRRLARIKTGAIDSLSKRGYGLPFRMVRQRSRKDVVTLASQVEKELQVEAGVFVVLCRTNIEDEFIIAEESALGQRDVAGGPILGKVIGWIKVRRKTDGLELTITKGVKAVLGDVTGKWVVYGMTEYPGMAKFKIVERSQVSEELVKMSIEGHWGWPPLVEDCTIAWMKGYEPFAQAMAETVLPAKYPRRDPRNFDRICAVNRIMMDTADSQAELSRREQWSSRS